MNSLRLLLQKLLSLIAIPLGFNSRLTQFCDRCGRTREEAEALIAERDAEIDDRGREIDHWKLETHSYLQTAKQLQKDLAALTAENARLTETILANERVRVELAEIGVKFDYEDEPYNESSAKLSAQLGEARRLLGEYRKHHHSSIGCRMWFGGEDGRCSTCRAVDAFIATG